MKMTKLLDFEMVMENLVLFLTEQQREFSGTQAYVNLCVAIYRYLTASKLFKEERKIELQHAKEVFEHLCLTQTAPDPTIPKWQEKLRDNLQ